MSENNGSTGNKKFLKGTLILTASSMVVKIIGSLNWIILSRILGGEGIGLYQMGFPIYLMAITVSSAGIPVAISIITAEKVAENDFFGAKRVFNVSLRLLFLSGLVFSSALWFGAGWLIENHWIRDARAYYSIIALAPAVFFVTFLASFRGYLQGWQIMMPTAASEVVEQLMRVVTMIVFAYMFMPYGLEYAAGGASMGAGVGAFCALLVLMWFYARLKRSLKDKMQGAAMTKEPESARKIITRLLKLALPVSMSSLMLPVVKPDAAGSCQSGFAYCAAASGSGGLFRRRIDGAVRLPDRHGGAFGKPCHHFYGGNDDKPCACDFRISHAERCGGN